MRGVKDSIYRNPTPVGRVTVRPSRTHPATMPHTLNGVGKPIPIRKAWDIHVDGQRTGYRVIDTWIGDTILDPEGHMLTCWHAGCSPGDLARLTANGSRAERYGVPA